MYSITEALMELAQKEKASLEQWKKQTDPFKEWIVEAKGRFDNLPHTDDGYDVVSERKDKLQVLENVFLKANLHETIFLYDCHHGVCDCVWNNSYL